MFLWVKMWCFIRNVDEVSIVNIFVSAVLRHKCHQHHDELPERRRNPRQTLTNTRTYLGNLFFFYYFCFLFAKTEEKKTEMCTSLMRRLSSSASALALAARSCSRRTCTAINWNVLLYFNIFSFSFSLSFSFWRILFSLFLVFSWGYVHC